MYTTDMMIHVHPKLDAQARADLERKLMGHVGVDCAEFYDHVRPNPLVVTYNPGTVERMEILQMVRILDPGAVTLGC